MKCAVCVISKNEDQYLLEWVEYYKSIGFDNVLFYDNNMKDNENQYKIIKPYIDNGFIKYHDFRNKHNCSQQHLAYVDCLRSHKNDFDWIGFFDIDEFLTLKEHNSIKDFLSSNNNFNNYWNIALRWVIMDDNDLIYNDKKPVLERFTRETDYQPNMKSLVNTKNIDIDFVDEHFNPHYMQMQNFDVICNIHGEVCDRFVSKKEKNPIIYLRHFRFKTVEECIKKINDGDVFFVDMNKRYECIDWFFKYNKITPEKILIIRQNFPEYDLSELIKKIKNEVNFITIGSNCLAALCLDHSQNKNNFNHIKSPLTNVRLLNGFMDTHKLFDGTFYNEVLDKNAIIKFKNEPLSKFPNKYYTESFLFPHINVTDKCAIKKIQKRLNNIKTFINKPFGNYFYLYSLSEKDINLSKDEIKSQMNKLSKFIDISKIIFIGSKKYSGIDKTIKVSNNNWNYTNELFRELSNDNYLIIEPSDIFCLAGKDFDKKIISIIKNEK